LNQLAGWGNAVTGIAERVSTGEKERFQSVEALSPLVARMALGPQERGGRLTWLSRRSGDIVIGLLACVGSVSPVGAQDGLDVTARTSVTFFGPHFDSTTGTYQALARVRNVSGAPIFGPLALIITGLDQIGVSLINVSGTTPNGEPYVEALTRNARPLEPGKELEVVLQFRPIAGTPVDFAGTLCARTPRVPCRGNATFAVGSAVFGFLVPPAVPPLPRLTLAGTATAALPGDLITLNWQVSGLQSKATLQFRVHAPGPAGDIAGTQWIQPGLLPPTGGVSYLGPDGAWRDSPLTYQFPAQSAGATVSFPTRSQGAWLIEGLLIDASGQTLTVASQTVLVSSAPGVFLRLNRPIATGADEVRATLLTIGGATPRRVRLMAWLVQPGGAKVGLPSLAPDQLMVYDGVSRTERISLLGRSLGDEALGSYEVQVRLFDAATGKPIGRAGAGFEVCDVGGTLTGIVRSDTGAALSGNGASVATVEAFNIDDRGTTATAQIGSGGDYLLTLTPGRYLVRATVVNSEGVRRAEFPHLVEVGCDRPAFVLDLTTTAPTPALSVATGSRR
jgi:hypothetical protein